MNKIEIAKEFAIETFGQDTPEFRRCHDIVELVTASLASGGGRMQIAAAWTCTAVKDDQSMAAFINKVGEGVISTLVGSLMELATPPNPNGRSVLREKHLYAAHLKIECSSVKRIALAIEIVNLQDIASANPPWNDQRRHDYALGAKAIYQQCVGISNFLDNKFQLAYNAVFPAES